MSVEAGCAMCHRDTGRLADYRFLGSVDGFNAEDYPNMQAHELVCTVCADAITEGKDRLERERAQAQAKAEKEAADRQAAIDLAVQNSITAQAAAIQAAVDKAVVAAIRTRTLQAQP